MRESIALEATQAVRRLRHHPSIALYCGNNEDYEIVEKEHLDYDWQVKDPEKWLNTTFPARYYYEHLFGEIVAKESLGVPYWPSSPFSEGKMSYDRSSGDIHQWNGELVEH
jgi:beta-mannosidase